MPVKIMQFEAENVKRIKAAPLTPCESGLTVIGGRSNEGKTSTLDALAWTLGGDRFRPSRAQRDGSVLPPRLRVTLSNGIVVKRAGKNSDLRVTDETGRRAGQQLLNTFVEQLALDMPRFMAASNKDKAVTLLRIIGLEDQVEALDRKEAELYSRRHAIGQIATQKAKFVESLPVYPDAPSEPVSVYELMQRLIGAGQGLSYEAASRDMSQTNYSSARQGLIEDGMTYAEEDELLAGVLDEIYESFVISAVLAGALNIPDFWERKRAYFAHSFVHPPKPWIDPAKEAAAAKVALQTGQKTFKQIAAENGSDWRKQIDDICEVLEYAKKKYGVDLEGVIFTEERTRDLLLPVQPREDDERPAPRPAAVYAPRLPELRSYERKAPFITHEILTGKDGVETDPRGLQRMRSTAVVRSCFCVYHEDEQEGGLALLNLMERLRLGLLEEVWLGKQFQLDVKAGLETLVYPKDPFQQKLSPFHLGEMITTWKMPTIERKVPHGQGNANFEREGPGPACGGGEGGFCKKDR